MSRRPRSGPLLGALLALGPACAPTPEAPGWIRLATQPYEKSLAAALAAATAGVRLRSTPGGTRLSRVVRREEWKHGPEGFWRARLGAGFGQSLAPSRFALSGGGVTYDARDARIQVQDHERRDEVDWFAIRRRRVVLRLAPGEEPPPELTLSYAVTGRGVRGGGRMQGRRFSGEALAVFPGERVELVLDVPPASALRFATGVTPLEVEAGRERAVEFRIDVDGEPVFRHSVGDAGAEGYAWHAVDLSDRAGPEKRVRFTVDGPPAFTSFFAPVLGPLEVGTYGARPWATERRDVVLFVADTFRADNLAAYGGELGVTPNIDRLAERSLCFRRAWSTGTYTLPAHTTMFTGLFPHQAGVVTLQRAIPKDMTTIAELLTEAGYRTGAVTDSGIVSQRFNMDQGFAWFDEQARGMEGTVARVRDFLEADDGRPLFLFVQSYRAHAPYIVSPEALAELGERLGLDGDDELALPVELSEHGLRPVGGEDAVTWQLEPEFVSSAEGAELASDLHGLYRGASYDLDRGFAEFEAELSRRGLLDSGYLVFTSDHGEAFGEHGRIFHGREVHESQVRIPLLVAGPGVEPGVVDHAASLIDLAPTLADLARIPFPRNWVGRPLLSLDRDRPIFSFECGPSESSTFAVVEGPRKVLGYANDEAIRARDVFEAYDLGEDPEETRDLADRASWPQELLGTYGPLAAGLMVPLSEAEAVHLDPESIEELRALGYAAE